MKNMKRKLKRIAGLSLVALATAGTSGTAVYLTMGAVSNKQADNGNNDYEIPDIDDNNVVKETPFSKTINSVINAKEISDGTVTIGLKATSMTNPVSLALKNLDVDLSQLNTSVVNVSTDINVLYNQLDQTLNMKVENNEAAYISYKGRHFLFNVPQNISDVMDILKLSGILVPNAAESTKDIDLSNILNKVSEYTDKIKVGSETVADGLSTFDITVEDLIIRNTKISGISLVLTADSSTYALKSIKTTSTDGIIISTREDENKEFEKKLNITLDGSLSLKGVSSYTALTEKDIQDYKVTTAANTSVLATVGQIIGGKSDIGIAVDFDKTDSTTNKTTHYDIDGKLQTAVAEKADFAHGTYALQLNHLSTNEDSTTNDLNDLYLQYTNQDLYLKFNDLIKAKVSHTSINDIFSLVTQGSGKKAIEVIASQMESTLGNLDIDKLKEGDMTQIQGLLTKEGTYFDYDSSTHSFVLSIDGAYLGLTTGLIKVEVNCVIGSTEGSENGIKSIVVSGLSFKDSKTSDLTNISVTLTPSKFTSFATIHAEEYSDFKGTLPLFEQVCNIIGEKKFAASYELSLNDKVSDSNSSSFNAIHANGKIGADLSSVDETKNKLLDSTSEGTYFLSMAATSSNGNYTHNLDMEYLNKNLYFGFDSLVKDSTKNTDPYKKEGDISTDQNVTVFKNYIENAQLGEMKDILDSKTDSSASTALFDAGEILDLLQASDDFRNDIDKIKSGSLKGLDSFLKIEAHDVTKTNEDGSTTLEKNVISLTVDTSKIFKSSSLLGKNVGAIVLTLNSDYQNDGLLFSDIKISTVISSDKQFTFKLSFEDYSTPSIDTTKYTKIEDAAIFTKAFYNLGNNISKYGVKVDAQYKGEPTYTTDSEGKKSVSSYGTAVGISGSAYWDLSDTSKPVVGGSLTINHPYVSFNGIETEKIQADQNIKFRYQNLFDENGNKKDGEFTADYNNNMHILMHSSTVSDLVSVASNKSETNVLNNLLSTASSMASSMPLTDVINKKDPSILLDYPYFHSVNFDDGNDIISLQVDKRLFGISNETLDPYLTVSIGYTEGATTGTETTDPTIDYIKVDLSNGATKIAYAKISLTSYDESLLPEVLAYNEENESKFVNLDGFKSLAKMMIDTTEFNYMHLGGYFNVDLSLFTGETQTPINLEAYRIDLNLNLNFYIKDSEVYTYISMKLGDKALNEAGYYVTEYALKGDYVYIDNTRTDARLSEDKTSTEEVVSAKGYRVTKSEFKSNILYYLVSLGLDMDDRPAGKTIMANIYKSLAEKEDASTTTTETNNTSGTTTKNTTVSSLTKDLHINLSSDFSTLFEAGSIYDENRKKFSFHLNLDNLLSVKVGEDKTNEDGTTSTAVNLLDFGDTYLKLYHQSKKTSDTTTSTPLYAIQLGTDLSVLDGLAKFSVRGQMVMNANKGDLSYLNRESDGSDPTALQSKMARFYTLTTKLDAATTSDFSITSTTYSTKKMYDFTKMELVDFTNDYSLNTIGDSYSYSVLVSSSDFSTMAGDYGYLVYQY